MYFIRDSLKWNRHLKKKQLQVNAVKTAMTTNKVWCHLRDWDEAPTVLTPTVFAPRQMPIQRKKKNLSIIMEIGLSSKASRHDCVTSCSNYLENTGSLESPPGFPGSHYENYCSGLMQPLGPAHSSKQC